MGGYQPLEADGIEPSVGWYTLSVGVDEYVDPSRSAKFPAPFNGQCGSMGLYISVFPLGKRRVD